MVLMRLNPLTIKAVAKILCAELIWLIGRIECTGQRGRIGMGRA